MPSFSPLVRTAVFAVLLTATTGCSLALQLVGAGMNLSESTQKKEAADLLAAGNEAELEKRCDGRAEYVTPSCAALADLRYARFAAVTDCAAISAQVAKGPDFAKGVVWPNEFRYQREYLTTAARKLVTCGDWDGLFGKLLVTETRGYKHLAEEGEQALEAAQAAGGDVAGAFRRWMASPERKKGPIDGWTVDAYSIWSVGQKQQADCAAWLPLALASEPGWNREAWHRHFDRTNCTAATPFLVAQLLSPSAEVRVMACESVKSYGASTAARHVSTVAFSDESYEVRKKCHAAQGALELKRLGGK